MLVCSLSMMSRKMVARVSIFDLIPIDRACDVSSPRFPIQLKLRRDYEYSGQ